MAAVKALAKMSPAQANPNANLLPPVTSLRDVSAAVALAVTRRAQGRLCNSERAKGNRCPAATVKVLRQPAMAARSGSKKIGQKR